MTIASITNAILRDRERIAPERATTYDCFACGRSFVYRALAGDGNGRFCSSRCQSAYDAGLLAYDPSCASKDNARWYSLPIGRQGFLIACAGCGKTFDSKGLRCCSSACEHGYRERQAAIAAMAEVGMEPAAKRKCETCGGDIPRYRGAGKSRRRMREDVRCCSARCRQMAYRQRAIRNGFARRASVPIPADSTRSRNASLGDAA
jgi:hypothetical protein